MISDTEFIAAADRTLAAIGETLDAADADLDWSLIDGILEIECEDRSKLIVNRHVPNREIWVAARAGGFHFRARRNRSDTKTSNGSSSNSQGRCSALQSHPHRVSSAWAQAVSFVRCRAIAPGGAWNRICGFIGKLSMEPERWKALTIRR
jgi:CyaY protein